MGSDKKCKSLDSARGKFNYLFKDSIFKTLSNSLLQLLKKKKKRENRQTIYLPN